MGKSDGESTRVISVGFIEPKKHNFEVDNTIYVTLSPADLIPEVRAISKERFEYIHKRFLGAPDTIEEGKIADNLIERDKLGRPIYYPHENFINFLVESNGVRKDRFVEDGLKLKKVVQDIGGKTQEILYQNNLNNL